MFLEKFKDFLSFLKKKNPVQTDWGIFVKSSDSTILGDANILASKKKIQIDLDKLEWWAETNGMKFNWKKYKALNQGEEYI